MLIKILYSRFVFGAVFFLVIQQLIVASSTLWIAELSGAIVAGKNFTLYLGLFVSSLFFVYFPGILSVYYLERAKSFALYNYTEKFSKKYRCHPTMMFEKEFQQEREPWLTNESGKTIEEAYTFIYDSASLLLNITLNIGALWLALDSHVLIGYVFSFIALPLFSKLFKNKIASAALVLQNARKSIAQSLLSGWDNILIGNTYNFSIWWQQFSQRWQMYNYSALKSVLTTQISSTGAMIAALIPVAVNIVWLFVITTNPVKLAALVVTLPRQIQIIQHVQLLSTYMMHWHGVIAKLTALFAVVVELPKNNIREILPRINWDELYFSINNVKVCMQSLDCFLTTLQDTPSGRITIQGKNGAGKTTLINLLKKELQDHAYYLPTHSRLVFASTIAESFSTGEKIKVCLDELSTHLKSAKFLLLDEWDANLDEDNRQIISAELDKLSEKYCIVEISHRRGKIVAFYEQS